tara:strand:- start:223 stop:477 length:255 start_codon:yes stop_codon:yes gene_type:complete
MKWFILVIMSVATGETDDGDRDTYLFVNPTFDTYNECVSYVMNTDNVPFISHKIIMNYGFRSIENIICVDQTKIKKHILKEQDV